VRKIEKRNAERNADRGRQVEQLQLLLQDALRGELQRAGVAEIEARIGVCSGYFRMRWHRGSTPSEVILAALLEMGVDPGEFFYEAFHQPAATTAPDPLDPENAELEPVRRVLVRLEDDDFSEVNFVAQGETSRAQAAALDLAEFLESCHGNKAVTGAIIELIRLGDRLTRQLVRDAVAVVEANRANSQPAFAHGS